jgi:hypothetical protein
MGATRARAIQAAIARHHERAARMPLHRALEYGDAILARLRAASGVERAELARSPVT